MMKKMFAVILAGAMVLSMAACGKDEKPTDAQTTAAVTTEAPTTEVPTTEAPTTEAPATEAETTEEEAGNGAEGGLMDLAAQIHDTAKLELMTGPAMELDLNDAEFLKSCTGLSSAEQIEEAVFADAMISSVPYSLVLVSAKEGADVAALKKEMVENVDVRKWICVTAKKVIVAENGNTIMLVMGSEENADKVFGAFQSLSGDKCGEALTRITEE